MTPINYTLDYCLKSAQQHAHSTLWKSNDPGAYHAARRKGWLPQCTTHMTHAAQVHTLAKCIEISSRFSRTTDWWRFDYASYHAALRHGWLKLCTAHMKYKRPERHTLKSVCAKASNYSTRQEWKHNDPHSYRAALKKGWMEDAAAHMVKAIKPQGIAYTVYKILTSDGYFYFGITNRKLARRAWQHFHGTADSAVNNHILSNPGVSAQIAVIAENVDVLNATSIEKELISINKCSKFCLNRRSGGATGIAFNPEFWARQATKF